MVGERGDGGCRVRSAIPSTPTATWSRRTTTAVLDVARELIDGERGSNCCPPPFGLSSTSSVAQQVGLSEEFGFLSRADRGSLAPRRRK
ncbi:hypothetical protein GT025_04170 [Streptomyces sp. SID4920]|nr:hypothetical protein [Streptomyces sp. SID4920]MYX67470.1 hypothetical protein [Streptomyces sp. SID8373]